MTYWRELDSGHRHLYDLRTDRHQIHNLVHDKPGLARRLARRMKRIADCADPCP